MTRNIFAWLSSAALAWLLIESPPARANSNPQSRDSKGKEKTVPVRGLVSREHAAGQLQNSVDAGDSYSTPAGPRRLLRLSGAMAIQAKPDPAARESLNKLSATNGALRGYSAHREPLGSITLLQAPRSERERQARDPRLFRDALAKV